MVASAHDAAAAPVGEAAGVAAATMTAGSACAVYPLTSSVAGRFIAAGHAHFATALPVVHPPASARSTGSESAKRLPSLRSTVAPSWVTLAITTVVQRNA